MKLILLPAVAAILFSLSSQAGAALVIYEGFNGYTTGAGGLVGANPNGNTVGLNTSLAYAGTGLGNYTVNASSLTFGSLVTNGGSITTAGGSGVVSTAATTIDLATTPYSGTLYTSHLVNLSSISATTNDGAVSRITSDSAASNQRFQLLSDSRNTSNNVGAAYAFTTTNGSTGLATGTTYLMIGRFTNVGAGLSVGSPGVGTVYALTLAQFGSFVAGGQNDAWLDGATIGSGASEVTARVSNSQTSSTWVLGDGSWMSLLTVADGATFDELRYGSTLLDITPIPEPSTFALLSLGVAALVGLRRRVLKKG